MAEILVAGETLIDLLPGPGETLRDVDGFSHRPGGAPANVAVGLSRLGAAPAFWTRLGGDPFGDFLRETLVDEGVPTAAFERVDGNTALAVVSPPGVDGRRFRFYGSGDVTFGFEPGSIPEDALASASWVHLGGVSLTHPDGRAAMRTLAATAAERGCAVSFDVNYREDLVPDGEREAVDATGAGDAFAAGPIARLSEGAVDTDLDEAVAFANATAALSVREEGGMTALRTEAGVASFLADRR